MNNYLFFILNFLQSIPQSKVVYFSLKNILSFFSQIDQVVWDDLIDYYAASLT